MDKLVEKYNIPKVTHDEVKNLNSYLPIKEIKLLINLFHKEKIHSSLFCIKTREGAEIPNPSSPYSLFEKLQILLKSIKATSAIQKKKRKAGTYPLWTCCLVQWS